MTTAQKLKSRRQVLGLTLCDVAERCGWKRENGTRIAVYESGKHVPSVSTLVLLAKALGCGPGSLIGD